MQHARLTFASLGSITSVYGLVVDCTHIWCLRVAGARHIDFVLQNFVLYLMDVGNRLNQQIVHFLACNVRGAEFGVVRGMQAFDCP